MSLLTYAVHYPVPEKEHLMIDAMHGFAEIVRKQPGVLFVDVFKNTNDGTIVSVTAWQSRELFQAGWSELIKHAPSDEWEMRPREAHVMDSV